MSIDDLVYEKTYFTKSDNLEYHTYDTLNIPDFYIHIPRKTLIVSKPEFAKQPGLYGENYTELGIIEISSNDQDTLIHEIVHFHKQNLQNYNLEEIETRRQTRDYMNLFYSQ